MGKTPMVSPKCEKDRHDFILTRQDGTKMPLTWSEAHAVSAHIQKDSHLLDLSTALMGITKDDGIYTFIPGVSVRLSNEQRDTLLENAVNGFDERITDGDVWLGLATQALIEAYMEMEENGEL